MVRVVSFVFASSTVMDAKSQKITQETHDQGHIGGTYRQLPMAGKAYSITELKQLGYFRSVRVVFGGIMPHEQDFSPETVERELQETPELMQCANKSNTSVANQYFTGNNGRIYGL